MGRLLLVCFTVALMASCNENTTSTSNIDSTSVQLFEKVESGHSKIEFRNQVDETKYLNALVYDNYLTGAGVALLDYNNDGLEDIYFVANVQPDRLYQNKGNMTFEDVTAKAGIGVKGSWAGGVAVADVNGDGWDDIYVCHSMLDDVARRKNAFFENQGDGTFVEKAEEYGIADIGHSIMATFLDYDKDNDLDLYIGNQPPTSIYERKKYKNLIDYQFTDKFYRNDNGKFVDVSEAVGIRNYTYALSTTAADLNNDGWVDIYVANDYEEPDHMYINRGNGTFTDMVHSTLRHMSNFSMGADVADINNDGWHDIFVADMVAQGHYRNKVNMSGMNPEKFWGLAEAGYHYQYMFNALQLNNGNGSFSEIGQMAGVSHTDWSWAVLLTDFDNDGLRDLFVTNGQQRDTRNSDFIIRRDAALADQDPNKDPHEWLLEIIQMAPRTKLPNYIFRNEGDLTFSNQQSAWGFETPTWTNGAAYGDLDNDGDIDLVLNNVNDKAFIYECKASDLKLNNYLNIKIDGPGANTRGLNAKAEITYGDQKQMAELTPVRGYMSSVQNRFHFGIGSAKNVDHVRIVWSDGRMWEGSNIKPNQTLEVLYAEAQGNFVAPPKDQAVFTAMDPGVKVDYVENEYDDYATEVLLPYKLSTLGPVCAKADVNGDGLEDMYMGGAAGAAGQLVLQGSNQTFSTKAVNAFAQDASYEDGGAHFFDVDGDGDQDLYVASGGNDFPKGSNMYQDRLYINDGSGSFSKSNGLPTITESTSVAVCADFDSDGHKDIFLGARQVPQHYGFLPTSMLLINDGSKFTIAPASSLPQDSKLGLVTDAKWHDLDQDGSYELLVTGEWMPLTTLSWGGDGFEIKQTASFDLTNGFWNRIEIKDIDGDGDDDIVAGNVGTNIKYQASSEKPFKLYANDFDGNGTHDVYLGYYDPTDGGLYPVRGRSCSSEQMPFVKEKFGSYDVFAKTELPDILEGKMDGTEEHAAYEFRSGIFYNEGGMNYEFKPLRNEAQIAPVHGIVAEDFNSDGHTDMLLVGNYYNREVETTRADAGIGCLFLGSANGELNYVHPAKSGVVAYFDARDAMLLEGAETPVLVIANNGVPAQFFVPSSVGVN